MRASFMRVMIDPVVGAEHDVPKTSSNSKAVEKTLPTDVYVNFTSVYANNIICTAVLICLVKVLHQRRFRSPNPLALRSGNALDLGEMSIPF